MDVFALHPAGAAAGGGGGGLGPAESGRVPARPAEASSGFAHPALPGVVAERQAASSLRTPPACLQPLLLAPVTPRADPGRCLDAPWQRWSGGESDVSSLTYNVKVSDGGRSVYVSSLSRITTRSQEVNEVFRSTYDYKVTGGWDGVGLGWGVGGYFISHL